MVPDITGGALCPRPLDPPSPRSSSPPSSVLPAPPQAGGAEPPSDLTEQDDVTQGAELCDEDEDDEEEDEELAAACRDDVRHKRLSMESGYSASEKLLEDEVVTVETEEQQPPQPPDQSELPSERLSLPSSQTDGKLANRDSGIDSISSPSHSEELCFAGVDDVGVAYPCSPALMPRLSSSSSTPGEGEEPRGGARRRDFSEEGDSDLEEEAELTLVLAPPKPDRQESVEVRHKPTNQRAGRSDAAATVKNTLRFKDAVCNSASLCCTTTNHIQMQVLMLSITLMYWLPDVLMAEKQQESVHQSSLVAMILARIHSR